MVCVFFSQNNTVDFLGIYRSRPSRTAIWRLELDFTGAPNQVGGAI